MDVYLADLLRLWVFFKGIPDSVMACMFVWSFPGCVKRPLQSLTRVDDMSLEELLALAQAIIKDKTAEREPVIAGVQPSHSSIIPTYGSNHHML